MGKPWAELSSEARLDAILLAVHELDRAGWGSATASNIAIQVHHDHVMENPQTSRNGRSMSLATRVTPGIIALRKKGLLTFGERRDGLSGTADHLSQAGLEALREASIRDGARRAEERAGRPPESLLGQ